MSLESATAQIQKKMAQARHIKAKVKFDFGAQGRIFVDNTQNPPVINHEDLAADTVLSCSLEVFEKILAGTQDPNVAFMTGKLKIKGSMTTALKLNSVLED